MESPKFESSYYLDCWLATASDWSDPTELQVHHDGTRDQDSLPQPHSVPPQLSRKRRRSPPSSARPRKRNHNTEINMDSDTASNASGRTDTTGATATSATTSLRNRPILQPTPPSSRRRSTSPTRRILTQLALATPSIRVCQPDVSLKQPPMVRRLRSMLINKLSSKVIPHCLQTRLQAADTDQFENLHATSHFFEDDTVVHPTSYTDTLWQTTVKIYKEARHCYDNHLDESAWVKVVNNILDVELGEPSMLSVHSVQTQSIDPAFLPKHISHSFAKKADLALAFSSDHPVVAEAMKAAQKRHLGVALSQMTDAYTSTVPLVCCLEVKERGGDYNEAVIQQGIWSAAGLERLRGLRALGREGDGEGNIGEEELPPFLGWTVVGHDWKLHISWKDADGNVIVLGPWRMLNAGTGSHAEILILIVLIRTVKRWLEEEYWNWMLSNVFDRMK